MIVKRNSIDNPETNNKNIPYILYKAQKQARQQIQVQRQQTQRTINYLERQAKKSVKHLEIRQKSLLDYYHLKQSRFLEMQQKQEKFKISQANLLEQRKNNSLMRENAEIRKSAFKKEREEMNKKIVQNVKSRRQESERKLSQERQLERSLLKKKNESLVQAIKAGRQHSRTKSQNFKRIISSAVKHDLINVQLDIRQRQLQKINHLKSREQELLQLTDKTTKAGNQYQNSLKEVRDLSFQQLSQKVKPVRSRAGSTRKGSNRSFQII